MVTQTQEQHMAIHFLGLPVTQTSYNGTVVPIILTVWVMSYIEKFIDKNIARSCGTFIQTIINCFIYDTDCINRNRTCRSNFWTGISRCITDNFAKAGWVALALTLLVNKFPMYDRYASCFNPSSNDIHCRSWI